MQMRMIIELMIMLLLLMMMIMCCISQWRPSLPMPTQPSFRTVCHTYLSVNFFYLRQW